MTYIILFSSDSVQLENKKMIEKIQVKIKNILDENLTDSFSYFSLHNICMWVEICLYGTLFLTFNDFFLWQYNYLKLMEVYVYANHPRGEARTCLANALGVLSSVREMADIKKARSINQSACSQSAQYKVWALASDCRS